MRHLRVASLFFLSASLAAHAQATLQSINLVQPNGKGRIVVPLSADRKWERILSSPFTGTVLAMHDDASNLELAYSIGPNSTTSAKGCLDAVLQKDEHALATGAAQASIKQEKRSDGTNASGQPIAIGSFVIVSGNNIKIPEMYSYAIAATRDTCAQLNVRKSEYAAADDAPIQAALQQMNLDADYTPSSQDYFLMGTLLSRIGHSVPGSAAYYQRALDTLPADAPITARRAMIDQLSSAYDLSGQADRTRPMNEAAIKADPDYPMYYYNLARADAEDGRANDAKTHLQQAWDRKAKLSAGQQLPDPTQDHSLQKLKGKSDFWNYVQTLK
jgi:tetratricopeptide (TPR) repeat protein